MSTTTADVGEAVRFLRSHPPFDALALATVERVAGTAELEHYGAGETIFSEGSGPVEHLRVVRSGAVEILHQGRVLDLLGEGELFGHASMLSGLPTGFEARAAEDTVCYRIEAAVAHEPLGEPAGLRFVTRSLLESPVEVGGARVGEPLDPTQQPVRALLRGGPVICDPDTPISEAARRMAAAPATSVVVKLSDGTLGILTDRDLRTRVLAAAMPADAPVSAAMSAPAYTCPPDRLGGDVLLEMLDRGFRHFPVVSAGGEIVGVIEDGDIVAVQSRSSFLLRERIAHAETVEAVAAVGAQLNPLVVALHNARVAPPRTMAVRAVVVDALTRRLLELEVARAGEPPAPFAWLALGSQGRRETAPSADVDCAIVWFGGGELAGDEVAPYLQALGRTVTAGLERCGLRDDRHGASASNPVFVRSLESWQRAGRSWIADPTQDKALLLVSVLVDSRPVWGVHTGTPVADTFRLAPANPDLLRLLARFALSHRPPTGFFRGLVVEHSGEHRGRLDLKHGGVIPIVDLARWAAMAAGVTSASTTERLRAAAEAQTLPPTDAHTLLDAFELINELRLNHQVEQLLAGEEPDDFVDPRDLSQLTRTNLREAFRAIASIQKRVAVELSGPTR